MNTAIIAAAVAAAVVTGGTAMAGSQTGAGTEVDRTDVVCTSTMTSYPVTASASSMCFSQDRAYPGVRHRVPRSRS